MKYKDNISAVILMTGNILNIKSYVQLFHEAGLPVIVHVEKIGGLQLDQYGIDFLSEVQSANSDASKCNNCTLEELSILNEIKKNPSITQKALAKITGRSERTIKTKTVEMQEKGLIERVNGRRNGYWKILVDISTKQW